MAETNLNLDDWLERVKKAQSTEQMWEILDEFRKHDWIPQERQQVFHTYMRVLTSLNKPEDTNSGGKKKNANAKEGPVWYEKM